MSKLLAVLIVCASSMVFAEGHVHGGDDSKSAVPVNQAHPVDAAPLPPLEGTAEKLTLADGKTSTGWYDAPKDKPKGAVLVVHEWWGLNDHIRDEVRKLKVQGYAAFAIDLYDGHVAKTPDEAGALMGKLDPAHAAAIEKAGIAFLKAHAPGAKIATLGWCMGGGESLHASLSDPADVSATIMYYGLPVDDVAQLKTLKGPLLGVWANKDGWITPAKVKAFDAELTQAGIAHEFHAYDADHAFANPTGGKFNPPAAKDADAARDAFLAKNLAQR